MLELDRISKRLGDFALKELSLTVEPGEYLVLLGPSGVGKTVLLEVVAGLLQPDAGQIRWQGREVTTLPPERRGFGLVYQDYALFPHLNVLDNIAYGLRARGVPGSGARQRAQETAERLGIGQLSRRDPETLSGGEKQRVALARALVTEPTVLLLDEPLAALDRNEAVRLRHLLRQVHRNGKTAFLHVTHNADEALFLATRVGVMLDGAMRQIGDPAVVFQQPSDRAVAEFLGLKNVFTVGSAAQGRCTVSGLELAVADADETTNYVWIRPEEILLSRERFSSSALNQFSCKVVGWEQIERALEVVVSVGDLQLVVMITARSFEALAVAPGTELFCTFKSAATHCF